jgi:SAM-dependent methyltransferase
MKLMLEHVVSLVLRVQEFWNRVVGKLLVKLWSRSGLMYANHRLNHLAGPEGWAWMERGMILRQHCRPGGRVLDIACGDGIYDALFLADHAAHVDACDFEPRAIARAKRVHARPNVAYHLFDATRDAIPGGDYDMASLFATFQYFTLEQTHALLRRINQTLKPDGCFVGLVPIYPADMGEPHATTHFRDESWVKSFMETHYGQFEVIERRRNGRRIDLYFKGSRPRVVDDAGVEAAAKRDRLLFGKDAK